MTMLTDAQILEIAAKCNIKTRTGQGAISFARHVIAAAIAAAPVAAPAPYPHQPGSPQFDGADAFEAYQNAQAALAPSEWYFRSRVADLLHLLPMSLEFAPGDRSTAERALSYIRAALADPFAGVAADFASPDMLCERGSEP